ncbi:hypothetical protein J6590_027033 [Homalodisca vitripennis]|nr:hypothetical protein J6590_027033 [Homalodisca vitripennis]
MLVKSTREVWYAKKGKESPVSPLQFRELRNGNLIEPHPPTPDSARAARPDTILKCFRKSINPRQTIEDVIRSSKRITTPSNCEEQSKARSGFAFRRHSAPSPRLIGCEIKSTLTPKTSDSVALKLPMPALYLRMQVEREMKSTIMEDDVTHYLNTPRTKSTTSVPDKSTIKVALTSDARGIPVGRQLHSPGAREVLSLLDTSGAAVTLSRKALNSDLSFRARK